MSKTTKILNFITSFYLDSSDFNGCNSKHLKDNLELEWNEIELQLIKLINDELVGLISPNEEMNTHIIRTGFRSVENQLLNMKELDEYHSCFYPRKNHLKGVVNLENYGDKPYNLEMALGNPQLSYKSFDLSILESYRNDPRYHYDTNDIGGSIELPTNITKMNQ